MLKAQHTWQWSIYIHFQKVELLTQWSNTMVKHIRLVHVYTENRVTQKCVLCEHHSIAVKSCDPMSVIWF